jgi:hypothetical protein
LFTYKNSCGSAWGELYWSKLIAVNVTVNWWHLYGSLLLLLLLFQKHYAETVYILITTVKPTCFYVGWVGKFKNTLQNSFKHEEE